MKATSELTSVPNVLGRGSQWLQVISATLGGHIGVRHLIGVYMCEFLVHSGLILATTSYTVVMRLIQFANSDMIPPEVGVWETLGFRGPGNYCLR